MQIYFHISKIHSSHPDFLSMTIHVYEQLPWLTGENVVEVEGQESIEHDIHH